MRQLLQLADDLLGQLAGRRQDDGLGPPPAASSISIKRNSESRGLARARLGLADDIESIEHLGNEGRLNGGGREVAGLLESLEHGRAQTHGWEPRRRVPPQLVESINPPETFVCNFWIGSWVCSRRLESGRHAIEKNGWRGSVPRSQRPI